MRYAASLPAFTRAGHRAELNQIFQHVGTPARFANAHQKFVGFPPPKIKGAKTAYFGTVFRSTKPSHMLKNMTGIFTCPLLMLAMITVPVE